MKNITIYVLIVNPLKTTLEEVFMQTRNNEVFCRPMYQKKYPTGKNQCKYCQYHRSIGHNTDDCRYLNEEVESLIRRGSSTRICGHTLRSQPHPQQPHQQELGQRAHSVVQDRNPPSQAEIRMMVDENQYIEGSRRERRRQAHSVCIWQNYKAKSSSPIRCQILNISSVPKKIFKESYRTRVMPQ